jgi:pimeloyl-ACP methyl ester carboxylesterase
MNGIKISSKYLEPLNMNGMEGRLLRMPCTVKKHAAREILLIYGHHASIERMKGFAEFLSDYGNVSMPDLPGFGGMDSFARVGLPITIESYADYMASFIKMNYKNRKVHIVAVSFGFQVITRMLQNNPDLVKKVISLNSIAGMIDKSAIAIPARRLLILRTITALASSRVGAFIYKHTALNSQIVKTFYPRTANAKDKLSNMSKSERQKMINFEALLWQINDVQSQALTARMLMNQGLCDGKTIDLAVNHMSTAKDIFFDHAVVEQQLNATYTKGCKVYKSDSEKHGPSLISNKEDVLAYIPAKMVKDIFGK